MANLVVTLLGQSNAQGHGLNTEIPAVTAAAVTALAGSVQIYVGGEADGAVKGAWIDLRSGTGYDIDHFGPEIALGLALADAYPGDTIYIIKHAEGSTNLYADWLPPAGATWAAAAVTIAAALAGVAAPVPIGIVWLQGESDANSTAANALLYRDNILTLIDAARASMSSSRCPFVMMALSEVSSYSWSYRVRSGQYAATRKRPLTWAVDSTGLPWDGGVHFTAAGQLTLGEELASSLQGRTSRPLIATGGRPIENVAACAKNLCYSDSITIADHVDLRPEAVSCGFGMWAKQQKHAAQCLWTFKGTAGDWRPIYMNAAGAVVSYANDGAAFAMATSTHKAEDRWCFFWSVIDRVRAKLELWRDLDMIAEADLGVVASVAPTGNLVFGTFDLALGDLKVNDVIWRKGAILTWDEVRRYLTQGTPFPTAGTFQIRWSCRENAGTAITSSPAGHNGALGSALSWSTLTRQKARATV